MVTWMIRRARTTGLAGAALAGALLACALLAAAALAAATAGAATGAASSNGTDADGKRWWSHVRYLADDKLEGRKTGSEGHRKAAQYVAAEFKRYGLKPAGTVGYLQPVRFHVRQIDEPRSSLELLRDGKGERVTLGEAASFSMRSEVADHVEAPAVFVGYGLSIPEAKHDDLEGIDLQGKIAVYLTGGPKSIPSAMKAHYSSTAERWKAFSKAGAIGWAVIQNPKSMDIPWERSSPRRLQPAMSLADPGLQDTQGLKFALTVNPAKADLFLAGSGHTIGEILEAADADKPVPRFPLAASFRAAVAVTRSGVESQNVAGLLPGGDPKLKDEYVVLTAHLDHLGIGAPIGGDAIYNGAMDDASGIATLIEMARTLKESKAVPKRSILFLAVTGEEEGLQGSKYFANHPTVDARKIVADLNVDMVLPIHPLRFLEVQGLDESTLGDDIRAVAKAEGVEVQSDREPDRVLFVRSDQYSFIRKGVPALAFKFSSEPGSAEEKLQKEWIHTRYHAPSDDLNQPVDLQAAARFDRLVLDLAERVADGPGRPAWKDDSFFRRFAN